MSLTCFAVAVDLWKIDGSRTAPQFTVLAAPGGWAGPTPGTPGHRTAPADADAAPVRAAERPPLQDNPLRTRRMSRGMTLKQLAKAAGLSPACVCAVETGRSGSTHKTRAAIEKALDMEPGALDGNWRR